MIGVEGQTLAEFGAVSEPVVIQMVQGSLTIPMRLSVFRLAALLALRVEVKKTSRDSVLCLGR